MNADYAAHDLPDPAERPRIEQLKPATLAVLEQRFERSWPDAWRELATSVYLSLIGRAGGQAELADEQLDVLAAQSEAIMQGLIDDFGGRQLYVGVGQRVLASARAKRVVDLVNSGMSYEEVAKTTGLVERYVRAIHSEWYYEERKRRQRPLF